MLTALVGSVIAVALFAFVWFVVFPLIDGQRGWPW